MYGIIDFPLYLIGAITIVLIPGPNSLYCLAVATQQGARQAAKVMAAIFIGDSVLILCAVGGAASLLKSHPLLFGALKCAGGLYLAYLGINMLRGASGSPPPHRCPSPPPPYTPTKTSSATP